jgi:adenylate cyclase
VDVSLPVPGFQGRPAIVVLPFDVVSGEENDNYVAAGLAEEVSTRIAFWLTFPVIARQSALALKRRHLSATEIGRYLGVRYVVEGSFRRSGSRLRVGIRLIGADTGHQLWADRFEFGLEEVFALQDELADKIAAELEPELTSIEIAPHLGAPPGSLDAWQAYLRGSWHMYRSNQADNASAIRWFQSAIDHDPQYGAAFGGLSMAHVFRHGAGWAKDQGAAVDAMSTAGEKSTLLAPSDPRGHVGFGWSKLCKGDFDAALRSMEAAVACNPSSAHAWYYYACALCFADEPEDALTKVDKALRLSPHDPLLIRMWGIKARCYYGLGDYETAVEIGRAVTTDSTAVHPLGHRDLAASLVALGRVSEAANEIERLIEVSPGYSMKRAESTFPWRSSAKRSLYLERLRDAGLADTRPVNGIS